MINETLQTRRSILDMEKALQTSIDSPASSKMSLYKEVMKANASNCNSPAGNHLTVAPTPTLPLKATPKKFDLKLICPHGMKRRGKSQSLSIELQMLWPFSIIFLFCLFVLYVFQAGKAYAGQKSPGRGTKSPSTPPSTIIWSFPPRSKVSCAPPDITVGHNGLNKDTAGLLTPDARSDASSRDLPREPAIVSDGSAASAAAVSAAAAAMASGLGGDFCCPSFGARPTRLVTSANGDPSSVTCSFL